MITLRVRGGRDVERILEDIAPKEAERLVKQTIGAISTEIMRDAKKEMSFTGPAARGRMKRATRKRVRRTRDGVVQTDIVVAKRAFYWRFYEYGDGHNPRRRMFGKALDKMRPVLGQKWNSLFMEKLIRRLARARNGPLVGRRGRR